MKRFVWVTIIIFGVGIAALMIASLLLQRQVDKAPAGPERDLRTTMRNIAHALREGLPDRLLTHAEDINGLLLAITATPPERPLSPAEAYNEITRQKDSGEAAVKARYASLLSVLDTFPSVMFPGVDALDKARVVYEFRSGDAHVLVEAGFRSGEEGYILEAFKCDVHPSGTEAIVLTEGETALDVATAVNTLLDAISKMDMAKFRTSMGLDATVPAKDVLARLNRVRATVMGCDEKDGRTGKHGADLVPRMVPTVGALPKHVKSVQVSVRGQVQSDYGSRRLWLGLHLTNETPVRIKDLGAGPTSAPVTGP